MMLGIVYGRQPGHHTPGADRKQARTPVEGGPAQNCDTGGGGRKSLMSGEPCTVCHSQLPGEAVLVAHRLSGIDRCAQAQEQGHGVHRKEFSRWFPTDVEHRRASLTWTGVSLTLLSRHGVAPWNTLLHFEKAYLLWN